MRAAFQNNEGVCRFAGKIQAGRDELFLANRDTTQIARGFKDGGVDFFCRGEKAGLVVENLKDVGIDQFYGHGGLFNCCRSLPSFVHERF